LGLLQMSNNDCNLWLAEAITENINPHLVDDSVSFDLIHKVSPMPHVHGGVS